MDLLSLIESYSTELIIGLFGIMIVLVVLLIINICQISKLKKRYKIFMEGNNAKTLEDTLIKRLDQVDMLIEKNAINEKDIKALFANMKIAFQKSGLVKYDAFNELGGKLSFSIALLDSSNDGYVLNCVNNNGTCYMYMKEIVKGNSVVILSEDEKKALDIAMGKREKEEE